MSNKNVDSPSHYNQDNIECIEAIKASMTEAEFRGYLKGNAIKYLWRYNYKGKPLEDLKKCQWYQNKLIERLEKDEEPIKDGSINFINHLPPNLLFGGHTTERSTGGSTTVRRDV